MTTERDKNTILEETKMTNFTTIENLDMGLRPAYDALIRYKHHVCVARQNYKCEYEAEIYEFVDEPETDGFSEIECRLALIEKADTKFSDSGSAIKWCFDKLDK